MAAKSPKQRKSDFDRIMRNKGQKERPDEPERMPCVLYLRAEARQEMQLQRKADQSVGAKPLLDSVFVERAILKQSRGSARKLPLTNADKQLAKARKSNETLLKKQHAHESELVGLQFKISKLQSQLADKGVLALHREGRNPQFAQLHQALKLELQAGHGPLVEAEALRKLIGGYLAYLCR